MRASHRMLASLVSGLAVTLSLVFVGFQIHQNTVAEQSATLEGIYNQRVEWAVASFSDGTMPSLLGRINAGDVATNMSTEELYKLRICLIAYLKIIEAAYRQVNLGVVGADEIIGSFKGQMLTTDFFREQWPNIQRNFDPGFISFFESEFMK